MTYRTVYLGKQIAAKFDGTAWGLFVDGQMLTADRPSWLGITVLQAHLRSASGAQTPILVSIRQTLFSETKCLLKVDDLSIEMSPA